MPTTVRELNLANIHNKKLLNLSLHYIKERHSKLDEYGLQLNSLWDTFNLDMQSELVVTDLIINSKSKLNLLKSLEYGVKYDLLTPPGSALLNTYATIIDMVQILDIENPLFLFKDLDMLEVQLLPWMKNCAELEHLHSMFFKLASKVFPYNGTAYRGLNSDTPIDVPYTRRIASYSKDLEVAKFHAGFSDSHKCNEYAYLIEEEVRGAIDLEQLLTTYKDYHSGMDNLYSTYMWEKEVVVFNCKDSKLIDVSEQVKLVRGYSY